MSKSLHSRKQALTLLLAAVTLPSTLASLNPTTHDYCVWACNEATSYVTFEGSEELDYYTNLCSSELFLQSFSHCIQTYCTEKERRSGLKLQDNVCSVNAGIHLPDLDQYDVSADQLAAIPEAGEDLIAESAEAPLDYAVVVSREWYDTAFRTTAAHFKNRSYAFDFVYTMYGFWGLVIAVGIVNRCMELLKARQHGPDRRRAESSSLRLWIRRRLLLPATFGQHCQESAGLGTIPPRLESMLLVFYLIMNIVFMFPGYDLFAGNIWYPTYQLQLSRYIGDRVGLLAIAQLPLAWIFATRNDPLLWLTGWSFATYNRFHRWVARICMIDAIIHSVSYSIYTWKAGEGLYAASWLEEYFYCGAISIITMSLMIATSVYVLRARKYDLFLIIHILLAVVIIVALYFHLKVFQGELNGFLWCCIAIWAFDRIMRLARTLCLGLIPRFVKGTKATATYDDAADIIRLDVTDLVPSKDITPGHYYYLYAPGDIQGYQSHPFTLCSWRQPPYSSLQASPIIEDDKESQPRTSSSSTRNNNTMHSLLIRPYRGFTGRLQKKLMTSSEHNPSTKLTVFLEGPYGSALDLRSFSDVLIIVGGSGITAAISHSNFLLPTQNTSVHVVWAVQNSGLVETVCANELKEAMIDANFDLAVYETRREGGDVEKMAAPPSVSGAAASHTVHYGRPDVEAAIREARQKCERNLAVVTCGPPRMADACRAAIVEVLGEGGPDVEFYNEALGW